MEMSITSSAFDHQGSIPKLYTCEGRDVSPQQCPVCIEWSPKSVVDPYLNTTVTFPAVG